MPVPPDLLEARREERDVVQTAIASRIRTARERRKLSICGLSERAHIAPGTISRYENGHVTPSAGALHDLGRALGVSPAWLLTGEGEGPAEAA